MCQKHFKVLKWKVYLHCLITVLELGFANFANGSFFQNWQNPNVAKINIWLNLLFNLFLFSNCFFMRSVCNNSSTASNRKSHVKSRHREHFYTFYNQQLFLILLVRHNYQYSPRQNLNNQWSSHKIFASSTIRITDNLSPLQVGGLKSMASSAHSAAASATSRSSEINLLETLSSNWL